MNDIVEWKDIIGWEGKYQVSSDGRVRSVKKNVELKARLHKGYCSVHFYDKGRDVHFYIHRLVALAFIPNFDNKSDVDHIDGDKHNNNVANLRWVSHYENVHNEATYGKNFDGIRKTHQSKEYRENVSKRQKSKEFREKHKETFEKVWANNRKKIRCIETGQIFNSCTELADFLGVNSDRIRHYCKGTHLCGRTIIDENGAIIQHPHFEYIEK